MEQKSCYSYCTAALDFVQYVLQVFCKHCILLKEFSNLYSSFDLHRFFVVVVVDKMIKLKQNWIIVNGSRESNDL